MISVQGVHARRCDADVDDPAVVGGTLALDQASVDQFGRVMSGAWETSLAATWSVGDFRAASERTGSVGPAALEQFRAVSFRCSRG